MSFAGAKGNIGQSHHGLDLLGRGFARIEDGLPMFDRDLRMATGQSVASHTHAAVGRQFLDGGAGRFRIASGGVPPLAFAAPIRVANPAKRTAARRRPGRIFDSCAVWRQRCRRAPLAKERGWPEWLPNSAGFFEFRQFGGPSGLAHFSKFWVSCISALLLATPLTGGGIPETPWRVTVAPAAHDSRRLQDSCRVWLGFGGRNRLAGFVLSASVSRWSERLQSDVRALRGKNVPNSVLWRIESRFR